MLSVRRLNELISKEWIQFLYRLPAPQVCNLQLELDHAVGCAFSPDDKFDERRERGERPRASVSARQRAEGARTLHQPLLLSRPPSRPPCSFHARPPTHPPGFWG